MRDEFGGPLSRVFSEFDERAFAAASIGQVHRARTLDGDDVAVKVQYPGVAEAVDTDLRNAMLLLPLVKRLAPSLDAKALATELRERIVEELDYELEAQNQRRIERLRRGHPFISRADGQHRALDSQGARLGIHRGRAIRGRSPARRSSGATVMGRSASASISGCCTAIGSRSATHTPAINCCVQTAVSASLTTGCCAMSAPHAPTPSVGSRVPSVLATRAP